MRLFDRWVSERELIASVASGSGERPEIRALPWSARPLPGPPIAFAATRAVAERMDPPEALGAMLEPLRNGTPHAPRRIHPAVPGVLLACLVGALEDVG